MKAYMLGFQNMVYVLLIKVSMSLHNAKYEIGHVFADTCSTYEEYLYALSNKQCRLQKYVQTWNTIWICWDV